MSGRRRFTLTKVAARISGIKEPRSCEAGQIAAVGLLSVVFATAIGFGFGSRLSPTLRVADYTFWSVVFLGGIVCMFLTRPPKEPPLAADSTSRSVLVGGSDASWIVLSGFLCTTLYLAVTTRWAIVLMIVLWAVVTCLRVWCRDSSLPFVVAATAMIGLMLFYVHRMTVTPEDPIMDLLPITKAAIHNAILSIDP